MTAAISGLTVALLCMQAFHIKNNIIVNFYLHAILPITTNFYVEGTNLLAWKKKTKVKFLC